MVSENNLPVSGFQVVSFTYFVPSQSKQGKISKEDNSSDLHRRKYFEGIIENLKSIVSLYPSNWTMRLYIDGRPDSAILSTCKNICNIGQGMQF